MPNSRRRGFIVYAPQNPYRGRDRFRTLQRKSNPVGRSLFSYILPQHQVTLNWLKTLPGVDPQRIAFYGTLLWREDSRACAAAADRLRPLESPARPTTTNGFRRRIDTGMSYIFTGEYEIFEWNMGHLANYAELSYLMMPRPFMVESAGTTTACRSMNWSPMNTPRSVGTTARWAWATRLKSSSSTGRIPSTDRRLTSFCIDT